MSSKICEEFVDDYFVENNDDEYYYNSVDDDSDDDEDSYMNRQRAKEEERLKRERREAKRNNMYKAKINCQLKECGKVLEGKLCWLKKKNVVEEPKPAEVVVVVENIEKPVVDTILNNVETPVSEVCKFSDIMEQQETRKDDWKIIKRKHEQTKPLDTEQRRYARPRYDRPEPKQQNNGVCKYILNGDVCPFGESCRFSHVSNNFKSRKIWMCRRLNHCTYGADCIYAHSVDEVKAVVRKCTIKDCDRVQKIADNEYRNTVAEHKCMRLHFNESIENFIKRTS